jgi:hypothetical protein
MLPSRIWDSLRLTSNLSNDCAVLTCPQSLATTQSVLRDPSLHVAFYSATWESLLRASEMKSLTNFIGALMVQNELGADAVVTTVVPDDNKKYLSADLLREERPQADLLDGGSGATELPRLQARC